MTRATIYKSFAVGILLFATALSIRLHHLDYESLFMDELLQTSFYPRPTPEVIKGALSQAQIPLDYLIGSATIAFGNTDFNVRLPAALFGSATILLLYLLLLRCTSLPIAALAGIILALSPYHIYSSQEARSYALPMFLLVLVWFLVLRIKDSALRPRVISFLWLLVTATLFMYSSSLFPLVVVAGLAAFFALQVLLTRLNGEATQDSRDLHMAVTLVTAIMMCLPMFLTVIKTGQRYAPRSSTSPWSLVANGFERFTLQSLWEALQVQASPFQLLFAIGLGVTVYAVSKDPRSAATKRLLIFSGYLALVTIAHVFIFKAATDSPFRLPYFGYLLPGMLIFLALALYALLQHLRAPNITTSRWLFSFSL